MDILFLIGRVLFSVVFITNGIAHLTQTDQLAGYAASKGLKPARPLILLFGAGMVLGGLGVLLGIWMDAAALLLFVVVVSIAVLMHGFWSESGEQRAMEVSQFNKNLSLGGGALILFFIAGTFDGLPFTLVDGLF